MEEEKSAFLILEEETGIISANPHLNQGFVKKELFKKDMLKKMGFSIDDGHLYSKHDEEEENFILSDISCKVKRKILTTRENRGKVIEVLEPSSQKLINQNKSNRFHLSSTKFKLPKDIVNPQGINEDIDKIKNSNKGKGKRQSRRIPQDKSLLFGGILYLRTGKVSNLYRDIRDLYEYYAENKNRLSQTFPNLIRMSLRLLCETAAKDKGMQLDNYLKNNFSEAKKTLSQNEKTTLSTQNIRQESIIQLLHVGAHNYDSSSNTEQTIAISIIIGAILTLTHGKDE